MNTLCHKCRAGARACAQTVYLIIVNRYSSIELFKDAEKENLSIDHGPSRVDPLFKKEGEINSRTNVFLVKTLWQLFRFLSSDRFEY